MPNINNNIIKSVVPQYGVNYDIGYIGFTFTDDSFISQGIAWFERWDRTSPIKVSHTFVVAGPDNTIEALAEGVVQSDLDKYFNDPHVHVFFKKPKPFNSIIAKGIVIEASKHIGEKYCYSLIVADAIDRSFIGHMLGLNVTKYFEHRKEEICSQLVGEVLQEQPEISKYGCLQNPARMLTPQMLFEDPFIFELWKSQS